MRTAFIDSLVAAAAVDPRIVLLNGDLGFSVLEPFRDRFPDRYFNIGIAEQNMAGIAAGLALSGAKVFTYSIANFPTLRCLEQIRNDICYHHADVTVVAVGGGFAYGSQGYTHFGIEDLAIMRALPDMTVIAPGDPLETRAAVAAIAAGRGPAYLRLGRGGEAQVHAERPDFTIGQSITLRDGKDLTLISTGGMLPVAMGVADRFAERGAALRVLSMHTIRPIDDKAILRAAAETGAILTLEEHSLTGGLGSAVADVLAQSDLHPVFAKLGAAEDSIHIIGSQDFMRRRMGDPDAMVAKMLTKVRRLPS